MDNDAGAALHYPSSSAEGVAALRAVVEVIMLSLVISNFIAPRYNDDELNVQKIRKKCRRLAYKCNCIRTNDVAVAEPPPAAGQVPKQGPSSSRSRPQPCKGRAALVSDDDIDDNNDDDYMPAQVSTLLELLRSSICVE